VAPQQQQQQAEGPSVAAAQAAAGDEEQHAEEGEEEEEEEAAAAEDAMDPAVLRAAEEAGIDAAFLLALPPELRGEVLASAGINIPPPRQQRPAAPAAPAAAAAAAAPAPAAAAAPAAAEPAAVAPAAGGGAGEPGARRCCFCRGEQSALTLCSLAPSLYCCLLAALCPSIYPACACPVPFCPVQSPWRALIPSSWQPCRQSCRQKSWSSR
jgi:hypothetical protein